MISVSNGNQSAWPSFAQSNLNLTESDYYSECTALCESQIRLLTVGLYGVLVSSLTVFGNLMVIVAVLRERNLRSATNMYVFSLAVADLIMGLIVMPLSVVNDTIAWPFDIDLCDLWRATDVFLSTASIMHLCVIAIERYSAVTNPIGHYVSRAKLLASIASVWLVSLLISYPAIIWWRATRGDVPAGVCPFTEDTTYLVVSSLISFYLPSTVIIFVYSKILRTAQALTVGLRSGQLEVRLPHSMHRSSDTERVTVRVHTGCRNAASRVTSWMKDELSVTTPSVSPFVWRRSTSPNSPLSVQTVTSTARSSVPFPVQTTHTLPSIRRNGVETTVKQAAYPTLSAPTVLHEVTTGANSPHLRVSNGNGIHADVALHMAVLNPSRSPSSGSSLSQTIRLSVSTSVHTDSLFANSQTHRREQQRRMQHEQKAVKTIALIICLFIVCWTPFFLCNLLAAIAPNSIIAPEVIFVIVSWLGYTNSCMNFVIYSYSLTDFRMAFKRLFRCGRTAASRSGHIPRRRTTSNTCARHKATTDCPSYHHSTPVAEAADER